MIDRSKVYSANIKQGEEKIKKLKQRLITISIVRFLFFLLTLATPFYWYETHVGLAFGLTVIPLSVFLYLVKYYLKVSDFKKRELLGVEINKKELKALGHEFSHNPDGGEFVDPNHINSYDLDLFGKGSLFQFLNRTVTIKGKSELADRLKTAQLSSSEILKEQELIQELSEKVTWRQKFAVEGLYYTEEEAESLLFEGWRTQKFNLKSIQITKVLAVLLPVLSIGALLFWIVTGNSALVTLMIAVQFILWVYESKNINSIYTQFGKRVKVLQKYGALLQFIENENWSSKKGQEVIQTLKKEGMPSIEIMKLHRIISTYDNRNNFIFGLILNLLFSWDYIFTYRLIKWNENNQKNYSGWMKQIAYFDSLSSLANYAFNHSSYTYPTFVDGEFSLTTQAMGHPLIHPEKVITNDFSLGGSQQTLIITGANMSGKSTFLRTVGVNMVLGMTGAPVCATSMCFKPVEVFSNMRTTDSLFDDESYFFAELKRLKAILEEVDKGRELLIILDEILKGTNSVDKLNGSLKLVERLIPQKTTAIIATHDLKLTEIEKDYPMEVRNKCFEISIDKDEMLFDYQLRDGVTTVMNATFLMKKMGIIN